MGNRISTEDLYKITQSLADRAVSDVKKRREDERKREEAIKKNREERLAAAAEQNRIPNYKGGSLWDQYKAALASGEAKNANDFITKRDTRNAAWNKVGAETLNDDMEALARSISSTYGTQFDPSKYYSQETINGSSDQVKKMRDRLNALAEYYNTYGGSDDQKKAVGEQIKAYDSELKFLNDLGAHYGQYSSPEAYETLYDNGLYTEKYQGKNYSDIQNALKSTTNDREKAWLEKNADSFMTAAEAQAEIDRIEKAMGTKNIAGQRWTTGLPKIENGKLVYNDKLYDEETGKRLQKLEAIRDSKINKETLEGYGRYLGEANEFATERALFLAKQNNILQHGNETFGVFASDAKAPYAKNENAQNEASRLSPEKLKAVNEQSGQAFSFLENADWATDDEKKIYDYLLYYKGGDEAKKYLRALSYELNKRAANALDQTVSDMYDKASGLGKTVLNIGSLGMNIIGNPEAAIDTIAHRIVGERVDPNSNNQTFRRIRNVIREKTGADLAKASEGTIFGKDLFGQNAANMLYGAAMSALDSLLGGFSFGEGYTAVMGGGAMADEAERLYNKGASNSQIFNRSFAAGLAEYITEKVSLDNLLKAKSPANGWQVAKEILKQAGIEGSEEMASDVLNLVADSIIMADRSEMSESIQKYKDGYIDDNGTYHKGVSEKEAQKLAWQDFFTDAMADGLAGALSGGMMSVGPTISSYKYSKNRAAIQIPSIDPGNAEGLVSNARINDISVLTDVSEALKNGDAEEAGGVISEGIAWYEFLKKYGEKTYGKNQWSEVQKNIDDSISKLKKIQKLVADGSIDAAAIDEVLKTAETSMKTTPTVDMTSANDEKLFSLLAKGEPSNSVIEKNILKDRGTLAAFERLTGLRIGGTTVSQKRADVREAFKAVSSSTETLKAAQNAIESGATATEGHKNAAVIIDQAIQANRAENSRLRNSEKVKSSETKAAIDATNRQHRFLETVRNYVINGGDLSGFTESPVANASGEGGTNSSEAKTTQEAAKKRVRADFSAYQGEITATEYNKAVKGSAAEQYTYFSNEEKKLNSDIKNIAESEAMTAEEKAEAIEKKNEEKNRLYALAKSTENVREMMRVKYAGNVDSLVEELQPKLKKYGIKIDVVDNIDAAGKSSSGAYFDRNTNTIKVSRNWDNFNNVVKLVLAGDGLAVTDRASVSFDRAVTQTIAHEIAHADSGLTLDFIKAVAGTQYDAFDLKGRLEHPDDRSWKSENAQKEENWRRYVDAYTEQAMLEMKGTEEQRRASAEKVVNDAYIFEEIMADMFGAAVDDMGHSSRAGENIFWAMNRNKPGIIKRILNALERFIAKIDDLIHKDKGAYLAAEQRQAAERLRKMLTGELKRAYGTDVKGEAAVESDGGKKYSLAGANSRTADLNSLGGAYQMYQNGVSMDTIRKRTGWWLGKDGKWRYEISDREMRFNPDGYVDNPQTVGDYVKHDKLFAAYPWIADIPVHMVDAVTGGSSATNGKYSPDGKFIELKKGLTSEKAKYVLSHELQHAIQQAEGFVRGTSPKTGMFYAVNLAYDLVKNNPEFIAESKPQDKMNYLIGYLEAKGGASLGDYAKYYYFQNYGETEARNVSQRLDMTEEERRAVPIENNGEVFSYDEVFEKIVDNLKAIGYNKKQIDTILKEGVSYDIEQTDVQTSADEVVKRRRNDREETGRLSDADENGRRPGEIYRTGKIPTAGVSESAEILDSERRNGGLRRGNRGTDSQNGALGAGSEAGKRLNEVSKPEKRFSLSSNVEQTKDLIAVHNMTAAELEKSLDLGGFPMPSIAIIKAADGHSKYGDTSIVFGKDTIDPKKSVRNKVYGGDAWTPEFPEIDYKANEKVGKRIRDKYYDLSKKYGYDNTRALYNYAQDLSDVLTSEGGEKAMIDKLYGDTGMMQIYLMDTGRERVANVNKETKAALTDGQVRQYEILIDILGRDKMNGYAKKPGDNFDDLTARRSAFVKENEAGIRKVFEKTFVENGMSAKDAAEVSAELALTDLKKYVLGAFNYIKNGAETVKTEFDSEATDAAIKKAADGEGYRKWVNDLFGGAEEKSGIRNSKDTYTASGNRRSFEALHWENNLENIVKAMLEQDDAGKAYDPREGMWDVSMKKYNSISEIKNDSSRLRIMNEAEHEALKEQYGARMQEIAQTLIDPKNDNYVITSDDAYSLIVDAVRNSKDESGILRYLKKYNSRATEKTASDIAALVRDIAEMPTGYFEAKPQRAVGFDEVKAVILPDNASGELISRLESNGINTVTYKAGDENSRLEALNGVRDVRFSLTRANDEYMKAVESGNVEEQQRLVDKAAEEWSDGKEVYVTDNETGEAIFKFYRSADGGRTVWDGNGHNQNKGVFLTSNEYIADAFNYGRGDTSVKHITVYAKAENPFRIDAKNNLYTSIPVDESMPEWLQDRASYDTAWSDSENDYIIEQSIDIDNLYPEAFKHGYDAVIVENVKEGVGGGVAADVVLKDGGKQMKSADPITYDDSGNVIPLTERFDSGNRDIRWSLAGTNKDRADAAEFSDSGIRYSLRKEDPPKKTLTGYKVFVVKNGKLYPPMVANPDAADTPVGVWLNADIGAQAPDSKTGRKQVKAGGKGTQGRSGSLAFRPGWHLGETPLATQFDRTNPETGKRELFPENFVWAECEIAADKNYQEEAMSYGYTKSGKFQHSLAGLPKLPIDGYYKYRTNPNPDTVPWLITGAMKVTRLLDDAEVNRILESKGLPPKNRVGGNKTLADLGLEETAKRLNGDGNGNIRYSLSANAAEEIKKALADKNYSSEIKLTDTTPTIMLGHNGVKNLPLMMRATHLRENILTREQAKAKGLPTNPGINYHGLGEPLFLDVIADLDNVKEAYRGTLKSPNSDRRENYFLLISEKTDASGNTINIPVFINETAKYNNVFIDVNKAATVFGREQLRKYINRKLADGSLVRIKRRSIQSSEVSSPIEPHYRKNASSIDNSVSQNDSVVNTQSMQGIEKDSSDERHSLVKSAQSELKALQKENEKLRQDVDDLKQELQLTHGRKLSRDALISSIQKILIDGYGVRLSAKELYPDVTNLYDMFYNNTVDGKRLKKGESVDTMRIIEEMDKIVDAVIENAVGVDDTYVEMKKLLPELRNTKLVVPMDARADAAQSAGFENWAEFRKANFGRVGFANEGLPVDTYYMELSERYPELFPDGITNPGEQAAQIADVVNTIRESGINEYQLYDIEDERVRTSIKNDVMDIIGNAEKLQTFADRAAQKAKDKRLADITKLKEKNKERTKKKIAKVRERYAEASKNRTKKQQRSIQEKRAFEQISKYTRLLDKPTTDKHVTEAMRGIMLGLLESVDTVSTKTPKKSADISDPEMSPRRVRSYGLKKFDTIEKLILKYQANAQNNLENEIEINQAELDEISKSGIVDDISEWIKKHEGESLSDMTLEELTEFNKLFRRIDALSSNIKKLYDPREGLAAKSWQAQKEIGLAQTKERKQVMTEKEAHARDVTENVGMGAYDANNFFNLLGSDVMNEVHDRVRVRQRKAAENVDMFVNEMADATGGEISKKWHGKNADVITLNLSHGKVQMIPSQLITAYLMLNQKDSRNCLFDDAGGAVIGKFTAKLTTQNNDSKNLLTKLKNAVRESYVFEAGKKFVMNEADEAKIISAMNEYDPRLITVADKISAILNGSAARLGNEVSMAMYGYKKFTTENYFPMRTTDDYRAIAVDPSYEVKNLLGISFAQERTHRAGKPLVIEDVFDVVGRHLTNMAQYNAFAQEIDNIRKMYTLRLGDGTSLKQRMIRAYGKGADEYFVKLLSNLSGPQVSPKNAAESFSAKLTSRYKAAAVAGNLSVVLKQPMSIFRALPEFSSAGLKEIISLKEDLTNLLPKNLDKSIQEMLKYSGIAKMKNWGSSENITKKSFEELYNKNAITGGRKFNEWLTSGAENADMWTWAKLWRMSKAEIDAQGKYTAGSKEYFEAVDRKFSDVIGKTQVVQSALDSSMAVQNANVIQGMLYAFQNEPLKQFNYLSSVIRDARRGKPGAKAKLAKTIISSVANTIAVSAISTAMSLLRGTLDRDDDDELWDDILKSFGENVLADVLSGGLAPIWWVIEGFGSAIFSGKFGNIVERLDTAALTDLGDLINKYLIKQSQGGFNLGTVQDIVNVASNLFGWSAKNIFRDVKGALDRFHLDLPISPMAKYKYLKLWKDVELTNKAAVTEAYYDVLRDAVDRGRYSDYVKIKRDMIYHGYTETKIKNAVMKSSLMDDLYELKKVNPGSYKAKVNSIVSSVSAVSSLEGKEFEDFIESAMKRREREDGGSKTDDEVYDEMHRKMEKEVKEQLIYIDVSKRAAYIKKMLKTYGEYGITEADILKVLRKAGKA